jgi:hypothetical protein
MSRYVPIAEVQAKEIRVRTLVKRSAVATRAMRMLEFLLGSPAQAGTPLLDSPDRDACDPSHFAVD